MKPNSCRKVPNVTPLLFATVLVLAACDRQTAPTPETGEPAAEAGLLPLPEFSECNSERPVLPAKWQAKALMQSFFMNVLVFGDFVYDESVGAFRFTLTTRYDLKKVPWFEGMGIDPGNSVDFLVTNDGSLFVLQGEEAPTSCVPVDNEFNFTVPSREWLDDQSECVGEAPILEKDQEWWKDPSGDGANWFWYNSSDQLPFRSMYYEKTQNPGPVYERFTFNYFPTFEEVPSTNLPELVELCQGAEKPSTAALVEPLGDVASFLDVDPKTEADRFANPNVDQIALIQDWIPGLSECSSTGDLPPQWPDQAQISVFFTAVNPNYNPFPSRVFYDWSRDPPAQNSTLYNTYPTSGPNQYTKEVALLTGETGHDMYHYTDQPTTCAQDLPGPQVPDWQAVDGCQCRGQIAPGTILNPSDTPTKILWCLIQEGDPSANQVPQVFWTWYSNTGTPVVFMQSNSSPTAGTGLNLADYYGWLPGSQAPEGTFDIPSICDGQPKEAVPAACHRCHLPLEEQGKTSG